MAIIKELTEGIARAGRVLWHN